MKIITPSVEIMRTGLEKEFMTPEQFIEKVGRTCYKSEDKITDDSAAKFVANLIKRGHEAMIEHWNLIFKVDHDGYEEFQCDWWALMQSTNQIPQETLRPYLRSTDNYPKKDARHIVSGNMRAWRDFAKACVTSLGHIPRYLHGLVRNHPLFFPEFQDYIPATIANDLMIPISASELVGDKERAVHQNVTLKFICDRGVSHEIVRHRVASFAQESTRYCNYSQDKFGNEITVIRPSWCDSGEDIYASWFNCCETAEESYFILLEGGATPQEARSVLPNSLKTEVIVTMNLDGWNHFFGLRCASSAHPDMQEVAKMAKELFEVEGLA